MKALINKLLIPYVWRIGSFAWKHKQKNFGKRLKIQGRGNLGIPKMNGLAVIIKSISE